MTIHQTLQKAIEEALCEARADDLEASEVEQFVQRHIAARHKDIRINRFEVTDRLNFDNWRAFASCGDEQIELCQMKIAA